MTETSSSRPIWTPSPERAAGSRLQRFARLHRRSAGGDDYASLHRWSLEKPDEFWAGVSDFAGIRYATRWRSVVEDFDRMPGARWFEGATLNFTDNLLRTEHDAPALVAVGETGDRVEIGRAELRRQVASLARAFAAFGVGPGDRVAGLMPNVPETVAAMLAAASLGAVWSSCSPDFGPAGVLERFGQIAPKVLVAADGYRYNGKRIDSLQTVRRVAGQLPGLAAVVVVGFLERRPALDGLGSAHRYEDLVAERGAEIDPVPVPFSHPLYILYSSGTTGAPKCIVHGVGGTLLQHQKEHVLHTDIGPGDVVFYFTTCGWMMWHWLVSALAAGATLVLYDGAPLYPDSGTLWRLAENEGIDVFGTSARYLSALEKSGYEPGRETDQKALKSVLSTGSPLAPSSFDFAYRSIKEDLQLSSISGGTDIISCFALGNPMLPVWRGELQCRGLGMDVRIFDEAGRSVRGRKGDLVCASPFPSMPLGFWNDPDGARYRAAYFEKFPGVWHHGDYAELTEHDGIVMYGRSDAVLNPGGVRIGTAEIYRIVEEFPAVAESCAVGQSFEGDTRIVLCLRLNEGYSLDEALEAAIRGALRQQASPRHVPAKIIEVADIPRTLNGKVSELAVRAAIHGEALGNTDALANPESLEHFRDRPELAS